MEALGKSSHSLLARSITPKMKYENPDQTLIKTSRLPITLNPNSNNQKVFSYQYDMVSVFSIQGKRNTMEDKFRVVQQKSPYNILIFGVFDGHGGSFAVEYVESNLVPNILNSINLHLRNILSHSNSHIPHPHNPNNVILISNLMSSQEISTMFHKILTQEILNLDKALLQRADAMNNNSGTTCLIGIIFEQYLILANSGDCRAIMYDSKGRTLQLTVDHKPQSAPERERIRKAGGFVTLSPAGIWRLNGILSVSRGFGDLALKRYNNVITARPDIHIYPIHNYHVESGGGGHYKTIHDKVDNEKTKQFGINSTKKNSNEDILALTPKFLVLATDGLWNAMTNLEVSEFLMMTKLPPTTLGVTSTTAVHNKTPLASLLPLIERESDFGARALSLHALRLGSTDNVTVLVVKFPPQEKYHPICETNYEKTIPNVSSPTRIENSLAKSYKNAELNKNIGIEPKYIGRVSSRRNRQGSLHYFNKIGDTIHYIPNKDNYLYTNNAFNPVLLTSEVKKSITPAKNLVISSTENNQGNINNTLFQQTDAKFGELSVLDQGSNEELRKFQPQHKKQSQKLGNATQKHIFYHDKDKTIMISPSLVSTNEPHTKADNLISITSHENANNAKMLQSQTPSIYTETVKRRPLLLTGRSFTPPLLYKTPSSIPKIITNINNKSITPNNTNRAETQIVDKNNGLYRSKSKLAQANFETTLSPIIQYAENVFYTGKNLITNDDQEGYDANRLTSSRTTPTPTSKKDNLYTQNADTKQGLSADQSVKSKNYYGYSQERKNNSNTIVIPIQIEHRNPQLKLTETETNRCDLIKQRSKSHADTQSKYCISTYNMI